MSGGSHTDLGCQAQTDLRGPLQLQRTGTRVYMLMRDAEGKKKEASKVKQTTKQSNTACLYVIELHVQGYYNVSFGFYTTRDAS